MLREVQKVHLRREEEKMKSKARIMVRIAQESRNKEKVKSREENEQRGKRLWRTPGESFDGECFYCKKKGHFKRHCPKLRQNIEVYKETEIGEADD